MAYVDGFLLPIPKRKVKTYLEISRKAGKVWKEHGALEYRECVGKDERIAGMMDPKDMPFDVKRMAMGGFKVAVDL